MQTLPINKVLPDASRIIYGCMGLGGEWNKQPISKATEQRANELLEAALENGINYFDHADIYSLGKSEQVFGRLMAEQPQLRQSIYIQSKCGIRFASGANEVDCYDLSREWIEQSVDDILRRLQCDYLDLLLLHRPDPLMEPEEIALAFERLQASGKVNAFGVSNMEPAQIAMLQHQLEQPLVVNQLEMSLNKLDWLEEGILVNQPAASGANFAPGMLSLSHTNNLQLQAWGSMAQGLYSGRELHGQPENVVQTASLVQQLAEEYGVGREAIVLAFLMRHPAMIQPVVGTTDIGRLKAATQALDITLTRQQWYQLFTVSRGERLP